MSRKDEYQWSPRRGERHLPEDALAKVARPISFPDFEQAVAAIVRDQNISHGNQDIRSVVTRISAIVKNKYRDAQDIPQTAVQNILYSVEQQDETFPRVGPFYYAVIRQAVLSLTSDNSKE